MDHDMPIIEPGAVRESLSAYPVATYGPGEYLLRQGTSTNRLLFLIEGTVEIVRGEASLARVDEPGAVFGDMAVILGLPHSADVCAVTPARCHVLEDAAALLEAEPTLALYVMTVLARRLGAVNDHLLAARARLGDDGPHRGLFAETLDNIGRAMRIGIPI
jgi:CRP/FNR family cyclic AMP-dependent transcriptional regulator